VRSVANRTGSVIFFQVPDVDRILKEGAFWDVYYEHCSYLSAASLKTLFVQTGFAVHKVWTGYGGQYLMIIASPTDLEFDTTTSNDEDNIDAIIRLCAKFAATVAHSRTAWQSRLRNWAANGQRTVLWGSGSKAVAFLTTLGVRDEVEYAVDINPYRVGKFLPSTGQRIA
jgi:hypothetical protein